MENYVILASTTSVVDIGKNMRVRPSKNKVNAENFARYSTNRESYADKKLIPEKLVKNVFSGKANSYTKKIKCKGSAKIPIAEINAKELLKKILYFRGYHANDLLYTLCMEGDKQKDYDVNVGLSLNDWIIDGKQMYINVHSIRVKKVFKLDNIQQKYDIFIDSKDITALSEKIKQMTIYIKNNSTME